MRSCECRESLTCFECLADKNAQLNRLEFDRDKLAQEVRDMEMKVQIHQNFYLVAIERAERAEKQARELAELAKDILKVPTEYIDYIALRQRAKALLDAYRSRKR